MPDQRRPGRVPAGTSRVRARLSAVVLVLATALSVAGLYVAPAEAEVTYRHTYNIGCGAQGRTDLINAFKDIGGYWSFTEINSGGHRLVQNHETDRIVLAQNCTYNFPSAFDGGNALPAIGGGYYGMANVVVTIDGNGSTFARTGSDRYRFLSVQDTGAELRVNNLTFTGGAAPNGAGIHSDSFMAQLCGPLGTLGGCSDAEADDGGDGGAIASVGVLRLSGATFNGNVAGDGHQAASNVANRKGGRGGSGGAVYSGPNAWLFVDGSTFSGNRAGAGGTGATMGGLFTVGGMGGDGGMGGGIGSFGHLQVTNSTFRSNLSGGPGAPGKGILGTTTAGAIGGFYGSGAALAVDGGQGASVDSSTFVDNGNLGGYGGAVDAHSALTITNSTFQHNGASWGGAIFDSNATVNVRNSTFVGNYSDNNGDVMSLPFTGRIDIANSVIIVPTTGAHTACNTASGFGSETNQPLSQAYSLHAVWGNFTDSGGGGCSDHTHTAANAQMNLGLPATPALNGGSTLSFAPATGSSLINAGDPAYCPAYDQRGMPRDTSDGGCDIGSVDHFSAKTRTLSGPVLDPAFVALNGGNPAGYKGITQNYPTKFYFSAAKITDPAQHYLLKVWVNGVEHDYERDKNGNLLQDLSLLPLTFADAGAGTSELWVGAKDQWIKVATGTPFRVLLANNTAPTLRIAMDGGTDSTAVNANVDEFTTHHFVVTVTDPDPGATWSFSKAPSCGANATLSSLTTSAHSFAFDCKVGTGGSGVRTSLSATVVDDQFTTNGATFLGYLNIVDQPTRFGNFTGPNTIPINTSARYTFTINDGNEDLVALAANPTWSVVCGKHLTGPTNTQTSVSGTTLTSSFTCSSDGTGLNSFNTYAAGAPGGGYYYNDATRVVFDPDGSGNAGSNIIYHSHNIPFTIVSRLSYDISRVYEVGTSNPGSGGRVLLGSISYPAASTIAHTRIDWGDGTVNTYNGWVGTSGSWATFTHPFTTPGKHTVVVSVDQTGALGTWVPVATADAWDYDSAIPVLSLPAPITLTNAAPGQSNRVHYVATATDPINGTYPASCSVANNAALPVGVTRISCSVTKNGPTVSGGFNVTVLDVKPPVIGAPTVTEQRQGDGVHVRLVVPFTDDAPATGQAVCNPASDSVFAQGTTLVTCTATDAAGNVAKSSFAVAVADGTGPVVNVPSSVLGASPNGAGVVKTFNVTATDVTGAPLTPVCLPASGSTFAPGTTTVECTATDKAGNVTVGRFPVVISGGTVSGMNDLAQQFQYGGGVVSGRRTVTVKLGDDISALTDDDGTGTQLQLKPDDDATLDLNGHDLTIDAPYGLPAIGVPPTASLHVIDSAGGGKLTVSSHAGAAAIGGGICQGAGDVSIDGVKGSAVSYTDGAMTGATGIGSGAEPDEATIENWGAANVPGDCTATLHGGTVTFTGTDYDGAPTTVPAPDSAVGADIAWQAPTGGAAATLLSTVRVDGEANGIAFSPGGRLSVDLRGGTTTDTSPGGPLGDPDHLQLSEPTRSGYLFGGWRKGSPTGPAWSYDPETAASNPESLTSFTVFASWIKLLSGTSCAAPNPYSNQCQLVLSSGDDVLFDLRGRNWTAGDGTGTSPGVELPTGAKLTVVDSVGNGQLAATGGDGAAGIGGAANQAAGTLVVQSGNVVATGTGGAGVGGGVDASGGTVDVSGGYFSASSQAWSGGGYGAGVGAGDGGFAGGTVTLHGTKWLDSTNGFPTDAAPGPQAPAATYGFVSGPLQFDGGSGTSAAYCNITFEQCNGFWAEFGYPVTFHLNGGESMGFPEDGDTIMFDPGLGVLAFLSLTLDGSYSDFAGWYTDAGLTHPVEDALPLTGPVDLYAKYGNTPLPDLTADTEPDIDPTDVPGLLSSRQYFATPVRVSAPSGFNVPDADVDVDYQWSRCTAQNPIVCTPIAGAPDQPTYTPRLADLGRGLQVAVTATADGHAPYTWTKRTSVVLKNNYIPSDRHAVNFDAPYVGSTASLSYDWNFQPQHLDYVWKRDGVPIDGAPNSSSYVARPADLGAHLGVQVTARGDGFNPYTITFSTGSTVINSNFTTSPQPTITITPPSGSTDTTQALIGSTLTAVPGTWAPAAQFSYQWYVATSGSETAIPGATSASYTIPSGSGLKYFYVKVTGSTTGYNPRSVFSDQLRVPVLDVHAQIGINTSSGGSCQNTVSSFAKLAYGQLVCGLVPDLPAGASVYPDQLHAYQWYRDGVPVANTADGTNSFRYQVVSDDILHTLSVGITVKAPGYDAVTVTSPTSAIALVAPVTVLDAPVLSGTPAVGQSLQVTTGTWSQPFPGGGWKITWLRDGVPIVGAGGTCNSFPTSSCDTQRSYLLTPADAGHSIRALVDWRGQGYSGDLQSLNTTQTAASNLLGPVPLLTQTSTPVPTITGPGEVGSSLTAVPGAWDTGVTLHYAWALEDGTAVGTDSAQLSLTSDLAGHTVSVAVTGQKLGYVDVTKASAFGVTVIGPIAGPMPSVVGTPVVGSTLTAVPGTWGSGVTLTQKWVEDAGTTDESVVGTEDSITLSAPMVGHTLTLQVTGTKAGYLPTTMYSAPVTVGEGVLVLTPTPIVVGDPRVGVSLQGVPGTWDAGVTLTQEWVADAGTGAESVVSTDSSFTPGAGLAGHTLTLAVTGSKPGYGSVSRTSAPLDVVAAAAPSPFASTPTPLIAGDPAVGATLSLVTGTWETGTSLTQQWLQDAGTPGQQVLGTGTTLRLTPDLAGHDVTVVVTGSKPGRTTTTVDSDPVTVRIGSLTFTPQPLVMGSPVVGATLTRATGYWDSGVTLTQEWVEDAGTADQQTLGTGTSLKLTSALAGHTVTLLVTGTKTGYAPVTVASTPVTVGTGSVDPTPIVTIVGVVAPGARVGAARSGTWPASSTLSYVWVEDAGTADHQTLATTSALPVTVDMVGHDLTLLLTATPAVGEPVTVRSDPVTVSEGTLVQTPTPVLYGARAVGGTLRAAAGKWDTGVALGYAWLQDAGTPTEQVIGTASTLALAPAMAGHRISLRVTGSKPGYADASATSDALVVGLGTISPVSVVTITGTPNVGGRLTAARPGWKVPSGTQYAYAWTADAGTADERVVGTASALTPTAALLGSSVTVTVTASLPGYATQTSTSDPVTIGVGTLTTTPTPVIAGTVAVDNTLTATPGSWGSGVTFVYTWILDADTDHLTVATTRTYKPTAGQQGHTLTLEVTGSKPGYTSVTRDSDPVLIS